MSTAHLNEALTAVGNAVTRDNIIPFLRNINRQLNILAVEDNRLERAFLEENINALGHATIHATNGREALDILAEKGGEIDVILMDRLMPVMDGLTAVWEIKNSPTLRRIPIVMITSATGVEDMRQGLEAGIFYYLAKPADEAVLRSVLRAATREAVQSRSLHEELKRHRMSFNLIDTCKFKFRTLEQAESLSAFMAHCFPEPERVLSGLAELMINAIEHGNLEIGYSEKGRLLENDLWQAEIMRRQSLDQYAGREAEAIITKKDDGVYIVITDAGNGFDWKSYMNIDPSRAGDNHGRGIAQARTVSFDKLTYNDKGNQVIAFVSKQAGLEW